MVFVSCATEPEVLPPNLLNAADVREIEALVAARPDIQKPIREIHVNGYKRIEVNSGRISHRVGSGSLFTVAKRRGKWVIDSPIQEEHIIVP